MGDLRYLKIYNTNCPQEFEGDIKLNFPEGLQLPLNEVRYLHWLKFPLKEVPSDFNPDNLVDLKLPYSEIERVWEHNMDAPKLKWVNLNHSRKLSTFSGLGRAQNLQELNLEGCTGLKTLHEDMQNMKCLVYLNMRGCTSLESLPRIKLISLKTLILSDCSKFKTFQVISDKLEALYLDGTAIKELPCDIQILQRLVLLNMKGCKKLKRLPDNLGELRALEELILSGCSKLKEIPESGKSMSRLEILLLDETTIEEIPKIFSVRRLCLSTNEKTSHLPDIINYFSQLQWLELNSLRTIAKPLVCVPEILFCTSFPGCEMPSWFYHEAIGSMVEFELPSHWNHTRLSGLALCVVVSFHNCQDHANLNVKFTCETKTRESSCNGITWKDGSLIKQDNEVDGVESDHVFIGYTNCLDFIKLAEGQDPRKCARTKASFEFSVINGTGGEADFEVLKSGFSFMFESE
ncbi:unnamed protein product [Arabis nemorensis]|uniref:C-JID domain-containing protein n=1 Tax=Arabis nemorensis TaxID=586526 RepID=A0A565CMQ5_9BRAS|nr:unnamed protein product [Arabis nemorensis]